MTLKQEIDVSQVRIDDVLDGHTPISVIKIDAEGAELNVLKGAQSTLKQHKPYIVLEAGDIGTGEESTGAYLDFLAQLGYTFYEVSDWKIAPHKREAHYNRYFNILAVHKETDHSQVLNMAPV